MKLFKGKKGFTLIELVVVIAILGILGGMAIPRFLDATQTARGSRIIADLRTIDSAIVIYNAKHGDFPETIGDLTKSDASHTPLLAAMPKAPGGVAKFPAGATYTVAEGGADYDYVKAEGLAKLNGKTAAEWSVAK